jgi:hypothetical protein
VIIEVDRMQLILRIAAYTLLAASCTRNSDLDSDSVIHKSGFEVLLLDLDGSLIHETDIAHETL